MKRSRTTQFRATSGLPIVLDAAPAGNGGGWRRARYRLWTHAGQTDFRVLLPLVAGDLRCLDTGDPRARRLPSGVALTADGLEAELATPPVRVGPGVGRTLDLMLAAERSVLVAEAREHAVTSLTGFSTHVNVSVPDSDVVTVARRLATECAVAIGLLAEPSDSSGLLIRPRRGRLEVGGEYAEGSDLEVLVTVLLAAVRGLRTGAGPAGRPPPCWSRPGRSSAGTSRRRAGPAARRRVKRSRTSGRGPGRTPSPSAWTRRLSTSWRTVVRCARSRSDRPRRARSRPRGPGVPGVRHATEDPAVRSRRGDRLADLAARRMAVRA